MTSKGYNMSSDNSCNFHNSGDWNNADPKLGQLQNNGGPTQTMAVPLESPAIDAGNPSGCRDAHGNLLTTDQRGQPRPDKDTQSFGCDMGAYERQCIPLGGACYGPGPNECCRPPFPYHAYCTNPTGWGTCHWF